MPTLEDVVIRNVSPWQKEDCPFCGNKATHETFIHVSPQYFLSVRCCSRQECQEEAKKRALTLA